MRSVFPLEELGLGALCRREYANELQGLRVPSYDKRLSFHRSFSLERYKFANYTGKISHELAAGSAPCVFQRPSQIGAPERLASSQQPSLFGVLMLFFEYKRLESFFIEGTGWC